MKRVIIGVLLCSLATITGCTAVSPERSNVADESAQLVSEPLKRERHVIGLSGSAIGDYVIVGDNRVPCVFFENGDGGGVDCGWGYMQKNN